MAAQLPAGPNTPAWDKGIQPISRDSYYNAIECGKKGGIKRGGKTVKPATQSLEAGGGKFIFELSAFSPTADIIIELAGRARTLTCAVPQPVLTLFR